MPDLLLTPAEAAEMLRVPRSTIYELARCRRVPYVKIGRRTLFVRQDIEKWIAEKRVAPRS